MKAQEGAAPSARAKALKQELFGDDLFVHEVAYLLSVDRTTVLRWLRAAELGGYKLGRTWRIPQQEIRALRDQLVADARKQKNAEHRPTDDVPF